MLSLPRGAPTGVVDLRVLVTGASGLVGSNVVAATAQQSWDVLGARAEMTDRKACVQIASDWEPDVIVHAAGESSLGRFESDPYAAQREYVGTEHTLAAARHVRARYVLVSSDQVYSGRLPLGWRASERDLPDPVNAHGRAKLACEEAVMRSAVPWLVVRPGEVYGVNATTPQRLGLTLRLVARLQRRALLPAPEGGVRSPIYARDFGQRLCELIAQGCEGVYNMAGPVALGRLAWVRLLAREFDCRDELVREGSDEAFMRACGERQGVRLAVNAGLSDEKATAAIGSCAVDPERGLALTRRMFLQTHAPGRCDAR